MSERVDILEREAGAVDIIAVKGRLDAGSSEKAEERINRVLDAGGDISSSTSAISATSAAPASGYRLPH